MNEMPPSWVTLSFGELNKFYGANIDPANHPTERFELYSIPVFPTGKPEQPLGSEVGSTKQMVEYNDVLISKINPRINRVWQVGPSIGLRQIASSEWIVFRSPQMDARFFRYYFTSPIFRDLLCSDVTGVGGSLTRAQPKRVAGFPVPVAPVDEQKRIADKLDTVISRVDAVNARLARVAPILKRFRQSVLAAATSGRLTEDWRGDVVSKEWQQVSLGGVASGFSYGSAAKSASEGAVPVLRMGNIQGGGLDWSDLVFTSDDGEIKKYLLHHGDVLFNRTNSPELVGKTAVFKGSRPAIYAGYLIRIRCGATLLPDYLQYCLSGPAGRDYCWRVKSDGVSQSNINAKKLAAFEFLLPPAQEQAEIVKRVEALFAFADRLEIRLRAAQTATDRLTPSLLAKAFRGELVPQDPNDEPASELLRRLAQAAPLGKSSGRRKATVSA